MHLDHSECHRVPYLYLNWQTKERRKENLDLIKNSKCFQTTHIHFLAKRNKTSNWNQTHSSVLISIGIWLHQDAIVTLSNTILTSHSCKTIFSVIDDHFNDTHQQQDGSHFRLLCRSPNGQHRLGLQMNMHHFWRPPVHHQSFSIHLVPKRFDHYPIHNCNHTEFKETHTQNRTSINFHQTLNVNCKRINKIFFVFFLL